MEKSVILPYICSSPQSLYLPVLLPVFLSAPSSLITSGLFSSTSQGMPTAFKAQQQVCRVVFSFQTRMFLIAALGDYCCKSCSMLSQLSAISTQKNKGANICYPTFHFNQQLQMYFALRYWHRCCSWLLHSLGTENSCSKKPIFMSAVPVFYIL